MANPAVAHSTQQEREALDGQRSPSNRVAFGFVLLLIVAIGTAVRVPGLQSRSLWLDEAYSAWFSNLSIHALWTDVPKYEMHPPLYYTLLAIWRSVFGSTEAALRSLSVLASALTIAVVACSGRVLALGRKGDQIAVVAALFLSFNAGNVKYAQEARPYALETLAATLAILSAARLQRELLSSARAMPSRLAQSAVALALAAAATMWFHDTGVLVAYGIWLGLALSFLLTPRAVRGRQFAILVGTGLGALAACIPLVPMVLHQTANMARIHFWLRTSSDDYLGAWYLITGFGKTLLICQGLSIMWGLITLWRRFRPQAIFAGTVLLVPLATCLAVSFLVKPIFIARLFEWMAPLAMFISATGIVLTVHARATKIVVVSVLLGLGLKATVGYIRFDGEPWRSILQSIASRREAGDALIVVPNELSVLIEYYTRPGEFPKPIYLPAPFPALGWDRDYVSNLGSPAIDARDVMNAHRTLMQHGRVWLVERAPGAFDPDDSVKKEIASSRPLISRGVEDGGITYELYGRPVPGSQVRIHDH